MKILFISSGSGDGGPKTVVRNQGESLIRAGVEVRFFCVRGKGTGSYLRSVPRLRKEIALFRPDVVHAHYSFSGFLASLAGASPLVVSLMGSDANNGFFLKFITGIFSKISWKITIVKSAEMKNKLNIRDAFVLPNGVDTELFVSKERSESISKTTMDPARRNILFPSDPDRPEKNFNLAKKAVEILNDKAVNLVPVFNMPFGDMVLYYNAAEVMLMTSLWEGSPNTVKEAMACNLPVITTDVGDAAFLLTGVEGCSVCSPDAAEIAGKIKEVLDSGRKSNGRERILSLGLDSGETAKRLMSVYLMLMSGRDPAEAREGHPVNNPEKLM